MTPNGRLRNRMQIRALNYWQCEVSLRPCCLRGGIYNNVQKMRRAINNIMTAKLQDMSQNLK